MLFLIGLAAALAPHGPGAPCATSEIRALRTDGAGAGYEPPAFAGEVGVDTEHFHIEAEAGVAITEEELALIGAIFEEVWSAEVDALGYRPPVIAEGEKFPVYMEDLSRGLYGYTDIRRDDTPYIGMNVDMGWTGSSNEDAWKVTAAHEFFHAIQFAYDYWEATWWMEASAVWAEDIVYDDLDDYAYYLSEDMWPSYPEVSMVAENGWHEYGEGIWPRYLDEKHGGPDVIRTLWEACETADGMDVLQDFFGGQALFEAALVDFSARNALGYVGLDEGPSWWPVYSTDLVADGSELPATFAPTEWFPDYLGTNYVRIPLPEADPRALVIDFAGAALADGSEVRWQVSIVGTDGLEWETASDITKGETTVRLGEFGTRWHEAWVIVSILTEKTGVNHDAYQSQRDYDKAPPAYSFTASLEVAEPGDTGDTADSGDPSDSGDTGDSGDAPPPGHKDHGDDGCGCDNGATAPVGFGLLAAGWLSWRRIRRSASTSGVG